MFSWYEGRRGEKNKKKGQEGEEEKEKMKMEGEGEEGCKAQYMVRSNAAFSGETKFTLPYNSVCVCVCIGGYVSRLHWGG